MGWIKYKYSCQFDQATSALRCEDPLVEVELSYGGKTIKVLGLIDSGCQKTNINADVARYFGIDLKKCGPIKITSAVGVATGYESSVGMKLKDLGSEFKSPVTFLENLPIPVLLGQNNFFETFDVKFEKRNNTFELKRAN